jgi:hypothetical protein
MLEGEGDALRFHLKRETLAANLTKAISQIEKQEPFAHRSQLR